MYAQKHSVDFDLRRASSCRHWVWEAAARIVRIEQGETREHQPAQATQFLCSFTAPAALVLYDEGGRSKELRRLRRLMLSRLPLLDPALSLRLPSHTQCRQLEARRRSNRRCALRIHRCPLVVVGRAEEPRLWAPRDWLHRGAERMAS